MTSNNITALISKFWENAYIVTSTIPAYMQTIWVRSNYINTYIENFGIFNKRHQRAPAVPTNAGSAQGHWFIWIRLRLDHQGALYELSVVTTTKIVETGYRSNIRAN